MQEIKIESVMVEKNIYFKSDIMVVGLLITIGTQGDS